MKKLLAMALVAVMAGGAMAELPFDCAPNTLGLFFDDFTGRIPMPEFDGVTFNTNSNVETAGGFNGPFAYAYLVLIKPSVESFETIEFGIYTNAEWIEGWADLALFGPTPNFVAAAQETGGNYSAIFTWPSGFSVDMAGAQALARFKLRNWWGGELVNIGLGPLWHLSPPSVPGHFIIVQGSDLIVCTPPVGVEDFGDMGPDITKVATFFGNGIIATEDHTLSSVKALFR